MRRLGDVMEEHSYSVYVLLGADTFARAAWLAVGAVVLLVALRLDDRRSFTLSIAACLLCSPIVWLHYFQLLIVPLAIARPRLSALWFVPLLTWLVPFGYGDPWQVALALGVLAVVLAGILKARPTAGSHTAANVVQA